MNIYALKDHKVICKTLSAGYESDQETAKKYLEIGKIYTIKSTTVHSWNTDVYLQEFPNVKFNSVFFEDSTEQSKEMDEQHPDYSIYN